MTNSLAEQFRQRAESYSEASDVLFRSVEFAGDAVKQATAIIGKVNANTLFAFADMLDYLDAKAYGGLKDERRKSVIDTNAAIRLAAARASASGDWSQFDKLVTEMGGAGTGTVTQPGGTPSGSG